VSWHNKVVGLGSLTLPVTLVSASDVRAVRSLVKEEKSLLAKVRTKDLAKSIFNKFAFSATQPSIGFTVDSCTIGIGILSEYPR